MDAKQLDRLGRMSPVRMTASDYTRLGGAAVAVDSESSSSSNSSSSAGNVIVDLSGAATGSNYDASSTLRST